MSQQLAEIRNNLGLMQPEFAKMLPEHVSPERFVRTVVTALSSTPKLLEADRNSLYGAAMKAARDGLMPDGQEAVLIPFNGEVKYIPMIGGILKRMRNSGEIKEIHAQVVYKDDKFRVVLGDSPRIEHERNLDGSCLDADIVVVYAVCQTNDGGMYREIMTRAQIEQIRKISRSGSKGPWVDWWGEMARKTVLRRLSKILPLSTDIADLIRRDDDDVDFTPQTEPTAGAPATRLDALMRNEVKPTPLDPIEGQSAVVDGDGL